MQKDADQRLFDLREKKRIFCTVRKSSFFFKITSSLYDLCMEKESIS